MRFPRRLTRFRKGSDWFPGRPVVLAPADELGLPPDALLDLDHDFKPVNGHPDDDECTHRSDGTDATYCGEPESAHIDGSGAGGSMGE